MFRAAVPSGASTGIYEALEMRDKAAEYHGKGRWRLWKSISCWSKNNILMEFEIKMALPLISNRD